jgi:hypothetical protein
MHIELIYGGFHGDVYVQLAYLLIVFQVLRSR